MDIVMAYNDVLWKAALLIIDCVCISFRHNAEAQIRHGLHHFINVE